MTVDRRRILQLALAGGTLGALTVPDKWTRPVVKSVVVPAHAQASPAFTTTTSPGGTGPGGTGPATTNNPLKDRETTTTTAAPTTTTTTTAAPTTTTPPTTPPPG